MGDFWLGLPDVRRVQGAFLVLALAAAGGGDSVRIDFSPVGPWVLGTVTTLQLEIHAPEPAGPLRPLRLSSNIGKFSEVTRIEAGRYTAAYSLPETRHPQVAVIALWRETGPDAQIDFRTIELWGKTKLKVSVLPKAEVTVEVGGRVFGPVTATKGRRRKGLVPVEIPIEVPPGVLDVTVRSRVKKRSSELKVKVDLPPYNRLALAVTPYKIPADGKSKATVHAYYVGDAPRTVAIAAPQGAVSAVKKAGSNRFIASFLPNRAVDSEEAKQVKLTVKARDRSRSSADVLLELGRPVAESILASAVEPFFAGADARRVKITVFDRAGLGVEGLTVLTQSDTSTLTTAKEMGNGDYEIRLKPPASYTKRPVVISVSASRPDAPVLKADAQLSVLAAPWPASIRVEGVGDNPVADPEEPLQLRVLALDAKGDPVVGRQLSLQAEGGALEAPTVEGPRLTAQVRPQKDAKQLKLTVLDADGPTVSQSFALAPAEIGLSIGAFGGLRAQSALGLAVGLEFGYRPDFIDRRLMISAAPSFEFLARNLEVRGTDETATGTILMLPVMLGLSFDVYASETVAVYLRGEGGIAFWGSQTTLDDFETTDSGLAYGGGGAAGFSYYNVYFEALARGLKFTSEQTTIPTFGLGLTLGYRLEL